MITQRGVEGKIEDGLVVKLLGQWLLRFHSLLVRQAKLAQGFLRARQAVRRLLDELHDGFEQLLLALRRNNFGCVGESTTGRTHELSKK